ncbi:MAG: hypothetical protein IT430_06775 [Phycisphaerales bacterium]|nr:hypothetical protein [Phycisphaerales bacterium]
MSRYVLVSTIVLVLSGWLQPLGAGQEPQPPDEAAALRARVAELEQQLAAAQTRISQLEEQLAALEGKPQDPSQNPGPHPGQADLSTPDELLERLKADYAEAFPAEPPRDERARRQHLRLLSQWSNKVNRDHRRRVEWLCEIVSRDVIDASEAYVDLRLVDPATREPVGSRFVIEWPARLRPILSRLEDGDLVRLRGLLNPEVRTNESRAEPGAFDIPPLIGPFVEFRFDVQVTAASAPEEAQNGQSSPRGPKR